MSYKDLKDQKHDQKSASQSAGKPGEKPGQMQGGHKPGAPKPPQGGAGGSAKPK